MARFLEWCTLYLLVFLAAYLWFIEDNVEGGLLAFVVAEINYWGLYLTRKK